MTIKAKVEGKEVTLELKQNEVASAISICEKNGVESVIVMKKPHKGGAIFFINPQKAAACQDRHNFDYSFNVKLSELKKFKPSAEPVKPTDKKDEEIASLKELVKELRNEQAKNEEAVKAAKAKDTEISKLNKELEDAKTEISIQAEELKKVKK